MFESVPRLSYISRDKHAHNGQSFRGRNFSAFSLFFLTGGCAHDRVAEKREDSFIPYQLAMVGQEDLVTFLNVRSATLFRADYLGVTPSGITFGAVKLTGRAFHLGLATAIDRRGYFLTAAHCVAKGPFKLVLFYEGQKVAVTARVVWRGDVSKGQPDLAVLDAALPLEKIFEWTPEFTNGDNVVALGLNELAPHHVRTQGVAGKILGLAQGAGSANHRYQSIAHDAPLGRMDGGGPLATPDGRLIGIDVSFDPNLPLESPAAEPATGTAQRPDLGWLKQLIDQDAAAQTAKLLKTRK
jgi:S1-C subfamily serine protease